MCILMINLQIACVSFMLNHAIGNQWCRVISGVNFQNRTPYILDVYALKEGRGNWRCE